jgi:hypothetical protein
LALRFAWLGELSWDRSAATPLGSVLISWLMTWLPLLILAHLLQSTEPRWMAKGLRNLARPALIGVIASLSIAAWVSEPLASVQIRGAAANEGQWLAVWPLLAVFVALFAAYCAFRVRHRALIGLAAFGALLHVAQFYYLLGTTLLIKSCLMLLTGAVLLVAAQQLPKVGAK